MKDLIIRRTSRYPGGPATSPRFATSVFVAALLLGALSSNATPLQAQGHALGPSRPCAGTGSGQIRVSEDSLGSWSLHSSLGVLRGVCPTARDTLVAESGAEGARFPAIVFTFEGLTAVAMQYRDSLLRPESPADAWVVTGSQGVLPREVSLRGSWGDLQREYGRAKLKVGAQVVARFCTLPRMLFTIDFQPGSGTLPLLVLPRSARIHHVVILAPTVAGMLEKC